MCPLSETPDPRYAHLRPSGWDPAAGKRLKGAFCEADALRQGYAACQAICLGHLPGSAFLDRLVCVFASSGTPARAVEPIPLGAPRIEAKRRDTDWIPDPLYKILRKCCLRHEGSPCGCASCSD